jgi:ZIP family zinc transporter
MSAALLWGVVAGSSFVIGGLTAVRLTIAPRMLGLLAGFGAGALIAAVAYELVDTAGDLAGASGRVALGLIAGSALFLLAVPAPLVDPAGTSEAGPPVTIRSISSRLVASVVPEAVVIVGSLLVHDHIAPAVIVAVFMCGVPESIGATTQLLQRGVPVRVVLASWAGLSLLCGVTAAVAYGLLDNSSPYTLALVLAIAGGAVLTNVAIELVPDAIGLAGRTAGIALVVGFALVFALVELA